MLAQLDTIQQKDSVKDDNAEFDKLMIQMSDLPEYFEKHYYLKGLEKDIHQLMSQTKTTLPT